MLQIAHSRCWDNAFYRIPIWYLRHKKSFSIDLELDIINKEIDSNLEMRTFTKTRPVLVSILMVSPNRETSFSPNSS